VSNLSRAYVRADRSSTHTSSYVYILSSKVQTTETKTKRLLPRGRRRRRFWFAIDETDAKLPSPEKANAPTAFFYSPSSRQILSLARFLLHAPRQRRDLDFLTWTRCYVLPVCLTDRYMHASGAGDVACRTMRPRLLVATPLRRSTSKGRWNSGAE
jgi:hypothetical protein